MVKIFYEWDAKMGDIYMTRMVACLRDMSEGFERFIDRIIGRAKNGDCDHRVTIADMAGGESRDHYESLAYEYEGKEVVFVHLYDSTLIYCDADDRIDVLRFEQEQHDKEMICEVDFDRLYARAQKIAESEHKGQTDRGGNPMIEHPMHVAEHVDGKVEKIVAMLHDTVEDTSVTIEDLEKEFPQIVTDAVRAITRKPDMDYASYIKEVKKNHVATKVKIEDMKHNMDISRIPQPKEKDIERVEKYERYLDILRNDYEYDGLQKGCHTKIYMLEAQWSSYYYHEAVRLMQTLPQEKLIKAMEVDNLLHEMKADSDTLIAGLLYTAFEQTIENIEGVNGIFGNEISDIYSDLPCNYDVPIRDRAEMMSDYLYACDPSRECKLILLALTITEMREYERRAYWHGKNKVFEHDADKIKHEEYFNVFLDALEDFEYDEDLSAYYWMLQNVYKDIFVHYYIDMAKTELYQTCELSSYVFIRGTEGWEESERAVFPPNEYIEISRMNAERIEDSWTDTVCDAKEGEQS